MANRLDVAPKRLKGIGGTDVAAIFGLSKWRSLPEVWLDKTGRSFGGKRTPENELFEWGRYLEGPIAQIFSQRTGRRLRRAPEGLQHARYAFMVGNPDRFQFDRQRPKEDRRGVLEVKTAMFGKLREWSRDGVPIQYYLQLQHYLELTQCTWGSFAVLFGGNKLVYFDVPRDEKVIQLMLEREREFWDYVERDVMPPLQLSGQWNRQLAALFPEPTQSSVLSVSTPEAIGKARRLVALRERDKATTQEMDELEAWFKWTMRDHIRLIVPGVAMLSWPQTTMRRINTDALRENNPAMAAQYTEEKTTRRFSVRALTTTPEGAMEEEEAVDTRLMVSARQIELD